LGGGFKEADDGSIQGFLKKTFARMPAW
jgi:hypothetical protein